MKSTEQQRRETISVLKQILPEAGKQAVTTAELAQALGVKPGTVRRGLSINGHYLGLVPRKLGNTRLLWPIKEN